jgi:hypothetical protein
VWGDGLDNLLVSMADTRKKKTMQKCVVCTTLYMGRLNKWDLKGHCHKIAIEFMEQLFGPKLMAADPFFCSKIGHLKATVHKV